MIHIFCDGGLGNRLLSAASAIHFAREVGQEFTLHWPANNWCGCNLSDLISNPYSQSDMALKTLDDNVIGDCLLLIHEDQINHKNRNIVFNRTLPKEAMLKHFGNENVFYYSNGIHASLTESDVASVFEEFELSESISASIDPYAVSECTGIHVRKTDYGRKPYMTVEELKKRVEESPDERFFFCSDDKSIEEMFSKNDNVIVFDKESYARIGLSKMILGDLLIAM
jgi:hypothetical protein